VPGARTTILHCFGSKNTGRVGVLIFIVPLGRDHGSSTIIELWEDFELHLVLSIFTTALPMSGAIVSGCIRMKLNKGWWGGAIFLALSCSLKFLHALYMQHRILLGDEIARHPDLDLHHTVINACMARDEFQSDLRPFYVLWSSTNQPKQIYIRLLRVSQSNRNAIAF
jgi:hypothetical protein